MKIDKTFEYEEKDLIDFGMSSFWHKRGKFLIIISTIFALVILTLFIIQGKLEKLELMLLLIYTCVVMSTPLLVYLQMKKSYKTSKVFQQEQNFIISSEGVMGKSSVGESNFSWDMFHEIIVYKKLIAFYISARQAYILPKRCFDVNEYEDIKEFLLTSDNTKIKVKQSRFF